MTEQRSATGARRGGRWWPGAIIVLLIIGVSVVILTKRGEGDSGGTDRVETGGPVEQLQSERVVATIGPPPDTFPPEISGSCIVCHVVPSPSILPADHWRGLIKAMYTMAEARGLQLPASAQHVTDYYTARAPASLPAAPLLGSDGPSPIAFDISPWNPPGAPDRVVSEPAISYLTYIALDQNGPEVLVGCDMRYGLIFAIDPRNVERHRVLAHVPHPAHVEPTDLDGDGLIDLIVADLGAFPPTSEKVGRVVWLRRMEQGGYESITLMEGVGRVADVRPGDLDGDGDIDLAIAVFGWAENGQVMWLENVTERGADGRVQLAFLPHTLDERTGAIHCPILDLDGDGLPDILVALSQEHEQIVAYLNRGVGEFEMVTLFAAPHPNFGISGLEPVDFDRDGDIDILFTAGDSYDVRMARPENGVYLLVNEGGLRFTPRHLTSLYGAYRALAADFDGDGDLDVLASAYLAPDAVAALPADDREGLVLLVQTDPLRFTRHPLRTGEVWDITIAAHDHDGDGDLDAVVGEFRFDTKNTAAPSAWLQIMTNQSVTTPVQSGPPAP